MDPEVAEALVSLCATVSLAGGKVDGGRGADSYLPEVLEATAAAAAAHGLDGALAGWAERHRAALPPHAWSAWRRSRLRQFAASARALSQIEALAGAFAGEGLRLAPLKGAAALLWLGGGHYYRDVGDLDFLVHAADVKPARHLMARLGYTPLATSPCPEDEQVRVLLGGHLAQFQQQGRLPVELHPLLITRPGNWGRWERFDGELWARAVPERVGSEPGWRLCWEHFLLHTATHYLRHYRLGFAPLKGLVDILRVLARHGESLDWDLFWSAAGRWGTGDDARGVLASVRDYWCVEIPGLPQTAVPLPLDGLARGGMRAPSKESLSRRVVAVGALPGAGARARFLLGWLFPSPEHLRCRYGAGSPAVAHSLRHSLRLGHRLLRVLGHRP